MDLSSQHAAEDAAALSYDATPPAENEWSRFHFPIVSTDARVCVNYNTIHRSHSAL